MPKRKKLYVEFPEFYVGEIIDMLLFMYVFGLQRGLPSVSIKRAVELFLEDMNLSEDEYPLDNAYRTWYRMHKKYVKLRKT